jgi:pilus assembly protein CpaC
MMSLLLSPKTRFAVRFLILLFPASLGCAQYPSNAVHAAADSRAAAMARSNLSISSVGTNETLHIFVGHSMMLRGAAPMRRIYVGNPTVLQSFTSGPDEIVLTAKQSGISSLVIWDSQGRSCLYTVSVDVDPSGLRAELAEAYPTSKIEVDSLQDRIELRGTVPTPEIADGAAKLASAYAKDIANSLRVVSIRGKQVQLKLRILEVDRTKMEQFGVNLSYGGKINVSTSTSQFANPLNLSFFNAKTGLGVQVQDLEQRQIVQILAEPTLTTLSGQPARFLSGGEFPFPVAQNSGGSTAISIQFRSYGVKVDFTPTVNADGSIRLKIMPEVSTLDYTNAVSVSGVTVPALSTRRAESEVELKDGESFVLSGLLDHRTTLLLAGVPGIANIPILGQFFRSKNNTHSIVELVLLVQATVVDPLTNPAEPKEPHWVVPNLDMPKFDRQVNSKPKGATIP